MNVTRRCVLGIAPAVAAALTLGCAPEAPKDVPGGLEVTEGSTVVPAGSDVAPEPATTDNEIEEAIAKLTLEQKVAQLFVVRPESLTGVAVQTRAGDASREAYQTLPVGGICWFAQNLEDPDQTREMLANMRAYSVATCGLPVFSAVDEEGGSVARVANNDAFGVENVGDMRTIGTEGTTEDASKAAAYIAGYLKDLGFNLDFAPDADVISAAANVNLVWRSFGTEADVVSDMVTAQVKAFKEAGVLCSPKHFPGIGYAWGDSETEAIETDRTLEEMLECELKPFKAAIEAGAPMIMVGHLNCPAISASGLPASLDAEIIQGVLREELGFKGLVITDALEMGALTGLVDDPAEVALMAFEAGCDLLLIPSDLQGSYNKLLEAVRSGSISEDRLNESLRRIVEVKRGL